MANIGYIQVVRHCNHFCGFCSNPSTPYHHTFETMQVLVDDLVKRNYFGVILTGGEPSLHPELPRIAAYARSQGLHVRMITNGTRLADPDFVKELAEAGVQIVHVSIYSVRPEVEARCRGIRDTLEKAVLALENAHEAGIEVNVNCVINKLNSDHLDENIRYFLEYHPYVNHFVWNNLDPSMGRAEVNQDTFTPTLAGFEVSLHRALSLLMKAGKTFRVERVPLCYMTDFAWASTETRKIVKGEERVVHFLDKKQTVRQTDWEHIYADACEQCSVRTICGGLFDQGNAYDPGELHPVFVARDAIVKKILLDPHDPSYTFKSFAEWEADFAVRCEETLKARAERESSLPKRVPGPGVGLVTPESLKKFQARRNADARRADKVGLNIERLDEPE
jgi:MoaA/NifB/PqqE/SkfB family radical SAM enzyme